MKKTNAIRLCAILTLSALILAGHSIVARTPVSFAASPSASEIKYNIEQSPQPTKVRILGASIFSLSILTAIIIISREIKLSKPKKERMLSKYYR